MFPLWSHHKPGSNSQLPYKTHSIVIKNVLAQLCPRFIELPRDRQAKFPCLRNLHQ